MKLKYIIFPFKTKEERKDMLTNWVERYASYPHHEELLEKAANIDVDADNTLSGAFRSVLEGYDFLKGYIKFVDFYKSVHLIERGDSLDKNKPIGEIFGDPSSVTGKYIDIFIAINLELEIAELENAERRLALAKSLGGDYSPLNILPIELIISISHHIHPILELKNTQGGGAKYNKYHKKEYNSKKRKSKRKKRKSKKRKKRKSKKLSKRR